MPAAAPAVDMLEVTTLHTCSRGYRRLLDPMPSWAGTIFPQLLLCAGLSQRGPVSTHTVHAETSSFRPQEFFII